MSHLTPHRTARITPGGSAVPASRIGEPAAPDTSWEGLIADLAHAVGLDGDTVVDFATKVDQVASAAAGYGDIEVARTRVRAALLGNTAMLDEVTDADLSNRAVDALVATWDDGDPSEADRILARLALLHTALIDHAPDPAPVDDPVGEGAGGSASPLLESDVYVGQVAYTLDSVPPNARDVIAWIGQADTDDDRRARAQAAHEVENQRVLPRPRPSVDRAITEVLGG